MKSSTSGELKWTEQFHLMHPFKNGVITSGKGFTSAKQFISETRSQGILFHPNKIPYKSWVF